MARLRLQTQLLISSLLIICALTGAILLILRQTVRSQIAEQVRESTAASVHEFESVQQKLQVQLSRTAALLAELPTLKALMTSRDAPPSRMNRSHSGSWQAATCFSLRTRAGKSWDFMSRERDWTQARPAINWRHPWGKERIRPGGLQAVASIGYFSVPSRREWETTRSNWAWWRLGMKSIPRLRTSSHSSPTAKSYWRREARSSHPHSRPRKRASYSLRSSRG